MKKLLIIPILLASSVCFGQTGVCLTSHADNGFSAGSNPGSATVGDFNLDGNPDLLVSSQPGMQIRLLLGNGAGSFASPINITATNGGTAVTSGDFNADGKLDAATANGIGNSIYVFIGNGTGGFAAPTSVAAGTTPNSIVAADFNADGKLDLVTTNQNSNNLSVFIGNGTGGFAAGVTYATGSSPRQVIATDFNADGKLDLAVPNFNSNNFSILIGNGTGGFAAAVNFASSTSPASLVSADYNEDGKIDLAVTNYSSATLTIFLGNGAGSFTSSTTLNVPTPNYVTKADVNSDGNVDLLVAQGGRWSISVFLGNGAGAFTAAPHVSSGRGPVLVGTADLNLDGKVDLFAPNLDNSTITVALGNNDGTFISSPNYTTGANPNFAASADFNEDGKPDLVTSNQVDANVTVMLGNGIGGFNSITNHTVGTVPTGIACSDYNADGNVDIAVSNTTGNSVSILLGNGTGGFGAATGFATANSPLAITTADFNSDGIPDLATANSTPNNVSILLGNGSGGFGSASNVAVGTTPRSITTTDLNNDGHADLAVANQASANVSLLFGNGAGSFSAGTPIGLGTGLTFITSGDFNGDGNKDLAVTRATANLLYVMLGTGTGAFGSPVSYNTGGSPQSVTTTDFNGDGKLDLATANDSGFDVSILLGDGTGIFGTAFSIQAGQGPRSLVTADFNLDGRPDLGVTRFNLNSAIVLLNTTPTIAAAGATTFCDGGSVTLNATAGYSYSWSPGGATTSSIVATTTGNYSVTVTSQSGSCSSTSNVIPVVVMTIPSTPSSITGPETVCVGNEETYSVTADPTASTYSWTLPNGWTGTSTTNSIVITAGSESGDVTVTASNSCGTSAAATLPVVVNNSVPAAPGTIAGISMICSTGADTYSITAVPETLSYSWSLPAGWSGASSTESILATANGASGNITVAAVNACGSGAVASLPVIVHSAIPATPGLIDGPTSICADGENIYSISGVAEAASYTWTLPGGWTGTSTGISIETLSSSTAGDVQVTASNSCGTSAAATLAVDLDGTEPVSPGTITGPLEICSGVDEVYSVQTIPGATSYTWTLPSGWTGSSTSNSITINANTTDGSIMVAASNSCGTGAASTQAIDVSSVPQQPAPIEGESILCEGSSGTFLVAEVDGATSYTWSLPSTWTGASTTNSIDITAGNTGGDLTVTASNNCGTSSSRVMALTVAQSLAQSGIISGESAICAGTTTTYGIDAVAGATGYTWSIPAGWSGSSSTNSIEIVAGSASGTISVSATNACGSTAQQNLPVTVTEVLPQPGTISGLAATCAGATSIYSIEEIPGATGYSWSIPAGWSGTSGSRSIEVVHGTSGGTISVSVLNGCGTSAARTMTLTVSPPLAQPSAINGSTTACSGAATLYSIDPVAGATGYAWTTPTGWTGTSTSATIELTPGTTGGTLSVVATNACGNSTPRDLDVSVKTVPSQPNVISGLAAICAGIATTYNIDEVAGSDSYTWTLPAGWTGSSSSASIETTAAGTGGNISVVATNSCGNSPAQLLTISVSSIPSQPGTISGPATICSAGQSSYTIASVSNATDYQWTLPSGWSGSSVTNSIAATTSSVGGDVTVVARNACGTSPVRTLTVSFSLPVKPTVTVNTANRAAPILTSNAVAGNQWFLNGAAISGATGQSHTVSAMGSYQVQVTSIGCVSPMSDPRVFTVTSTVDLNADFPRPTVHPNPADDRIILHVAGFDPLLPVDVSIMDGFGRRIKSLRALEGTDVELDVSTYSQGLYFILAVQGSLTEQVRFVKK